MFKEILRNKINQEKENINELKFNNDLHSKLEKYEEKIIEYRKNFDKIKNLIYEMKNKIKEENEKNINIQKELDLRNKKNEELLEENKKLNQYIQEYLKQIEDYKKQKEVDDSNNIKTSKEISNKEKEINRKIGFLEDKENLIEKENNEMKMDRDKFKNEKDGNLKLKEENEKLILKHKELEKEINEKQNIYNKIQIQISEKNNLLNINNVNQNKEVDNVIPLVGLNNIGATSFMNAILQCLSQTKELTKYFLNKKNIDRIMNNNIAVQNNNELQLSPVFYELIQNLWNKKSPKSISPTNFMNIIEKMNPLFKRGQAGDSKDFIIYILEQLHKELKISVKNNNIGIGNINQPPNPYDKNITFAYFFDNFQEQCSKISDLFFGFIETTNECTNCKNIYNSQGQNNPVYYNYQTFNCLIFPLDEVKNMKNNLLQMNNNYINQNSRVSIYDYFYYFQKTRYYTGQNKNYCTLCKQLTDSLYTNKIFVGPNILILILNKGKENIFNVKLDFFETIDITQFVLQKDRPTISYNLYGVITCIGQSDSSSLFIALCKNQINNKWYRFNDAFISPINDFQKDVIEFGTPHILFYRRNN